MIKVNQLFFSFSGLAPYLFSNLDLEVPKGTYLSIIGDNGSGKSTLIRLLLGFLKPVSGSVIIDSDRIGYVPQKKDVSNANFPITVYELLDSYRKLLHIRDKEIIEQSLKMVGMDEYKNFLVGNLSGGQTQKIFIARAFMGNPDLIILDEPSTGIDMESQTEIYKLLKKMNKEDGKTIVAIEHNLDAVVTNSTKIYHLQNGRGHFCDIAKYKEEYFNYKGRE